MHHMNMPVDYHVWGPMLERYQDACQNWTASHCTERPFCRR